MGEHHPSYARVLECRAALEDPSVAYETLVEVKGEYTRLGPSRSVSRFA